MIIYDKDGITIEKEIKNGHPSQVVKVNGEFKYRSWIEGLSNERLIAYLLRYHERKLREKQTAE